MKGSEMETKQELFNIVVRHLLTQNKKSTLGPKNYSCAYRGADGTKCAIGCLIPDEEYHESLEGVAAWALMQNRNYSDRVGAVLKKRLDVLGGNLACDLQDAHDNYPVEMWADQLKKIATLHNLTMPDQNDA